MSIYVAGLILISVTVTWGFICMVPGVNIVRINMNSKGMFTLIAICLCVFVNLLTHGINLFTLMEIDKLEGNFSTQIGLLLVMLPGLFYSGFSTLRIAKVLNKYNNSNK